MDLDIEEVVSLVKDNLDDSFRDPDSAPASDFSNSDSSGSDSSSNSDSSSDSH